MGQFVFDPYLRTGEKDRRASRLEDREKQEDEEKQIQGQTVRLNRQTVRLNKVLVRRAASDLHHVCLTFTTLWANVTDNKGTIFFSYFFQKIGFDISCKLSPVGTNCMKYQKLSY